MDRDELDDDVYEQLDGLDTLDESEPLDPLDRGWSPPEKPRGVEDWGITAREVADGEDLDHRLARELPDNWGGNDDGDGIGDSSDTDGELWDEEVGGARSGRLALEDESADGELHARDIGIDGAGASAEEAAVHTVGEL
jgi:hypothetical protein